MAKLIIDGHDVEVDEGKTILEAAKELGIEIPTLCHHRAIPPAGACRVCMVEVKAGGRPGLVPACAYPAMDGLDIETQSDRAVESRALTLELMLAKCPDVEIVKEMAKQHGVNSTPFIAPAHEDSGKESEENTGESVWPQVYR